MNADACCLFCLPADQTSYCVHLMQVNPSSKTPGEGVRYFGRCSCGCCLRRLRPDPLGMVSWALWCDRRCYLHDRAHADAANGIQHQQEVCTSYTLFMSILCGGFQSLVEVRSRQGLPYLGGVSCIMQVCSAGRSGILRWICGGPSCGRGGRHEPFHGSHCLPGNSLHIRMLFRSR